MTDRPQVRLVGARGAEFTFDLPLADVYVDQLIRGRIEPADQESAERVAPLIEERLSYFEQQRALGERRRQEQAEARERARRAAAEERAAADAQLRRSLAPRTRRRDDEAAAPKDGSGEAPAAPSTEDEPGNVEATGEAGLSLRSAGFGVEEKSE